MTDRTDLFKDFYLRSFWKWAFKKYKNAKLADFLTVRVAKVHREGYECTSNFRFAEIGNETEEKRYKEIAAEGC